MKLLNSQFMLHWPTGFIVKVEIQSFQAHKGINILFGGGLSFRDPEMEWAIQDLN